MSMKSLKSWELWLKGMAVAAISGFGNGALLMVVDPNTFNFGAGFALLMKICAMQSLIGAILYLKRSPLPEVQVEDPATK